MKILKLSFKNLNSLYGEWNIDFTHEDYVNNGIFAITGATGAGKSTILDAICLALYGRTPRLKVISNSTNEIMSRNTGDCYSEVIFSTNHGVYRINWSQHRARKKVDGNLIDSKHEISDYNTGKILATKKREVSDKVIEKTGLDFERFTRSILLAQNGFSKFLNASSDERSPILEQITGTEIYSEISKKTYERFKGEREKLESIIQNIKNVSVLSSDEKNDLKLKIKELSENRDKLNKILDKKRKLLQKKINLEESVQELKVLEEKRTDLIKRTKEYEKTFVLLNKAKLAQKIFSVFNDLERIDKNIIKAEENININNKKLNDLNLDLKKDKDKFKIIENRSIQIKEEYNKNIPLFKRVREIDFNVKSFLKETKKINDEINNLKSEIGKIEEYEISFKKEIEQKKDQLKRLKHDESSEKIIEKLKENESVLIFKLENINKRIEDCSKIKKNIQTYKKAIDDNKSLIEKNNQKIKEINVLILDLKKSIKDLEEQKKELLNGRLLRELRSDYENLLEKKGFIEKINSLEDERKRLIDGQDCPLCGSKDHPYAYGNIPEKSQIEKKIEILKNKIKKIDKIENSLNDFDLRLNKKNIELTVFEKNEIAYSNDNKSLIIKNSELKENLDDFEKMIQKEINEINHNFLLDLNMELNRDNLFEIKNKVQLKIKIYNDRISKINSIDEELKELGLKLEKSIERKKFLNENLNKFSDDIKKIIDKSQHLEKERLDIFENKDVDKEEDNSIKKLDNINEQKKNLEIKINKGIEGQKFLNENITSLKSELINLNEEREIIQKNFDLSLKVNGFENKQDFVNSILEQEKINEFENLRSDIEEKKSNIENNIKLNLEKKEKLEKEIGFNIDKNKLYDEVRDFDNNISLIDKDCGALEQILKDDKEKQESVSKDISKKEKQEKEFERWSKLNELIGSADGKKFRNFAQGITFEIMINHANEQLQKITDRYLLIRDLEEPLELNVIDSYQGGEIRSTKNLSGGESFIVSVALALGFSNMASKNINVESLFLDEGFGTLDDEALESALDTLATLNRSGRVIGVISHVNSLKERISTQINVVLRSGGKSVIKGPGVANK